MSRLTINIAWCSGASCTSQPRGTGSRHDGIDTQQRHQHGYHTAIATPLNWLDAIVISLLSGAITLVSVCWRRLRWRSFTGGARSLSPLLRWVVAAGCGLLAALLFVLRMTASHQTDRGCIGLCGALVAVAVLLLLMGGCDRRVPSRFVATGKGSPPAAPAPPVDVPLLPLLRFARATAGRGAA